MTAAHALMKRETRVRYGRTPRSLVGEPLPESSWQIKGKEFLLRGEGEHYFYYRKGEGIIVERGACTDVSEESLWLNGSVYAAIASLNGLVPIHASAVATERGVFAFTAPAGGGKSTLVAALGTYGLPMFCDDTLVLDISNSDGIICLPGHKRLKLSAEAIEMARATREEKVSTTLEKFYASPTSGSAGHCLPLFELVFLEEGPEPAISPITGAERLVRLQDDHYTSLLFAWARNFDRTGQFAHLSSLAAQIKMARFARPRARSRFEEGVALAAQYVIYGRTS